MTTLNEIRDISPDISEANPGYWDEVANGSLFEGEADGTRTEAEVLKNFNSGLPMSAEQVRAIRGQILRPDQHEHSELDDGQVDAIIRGVSSWAQEQVSAATGNLPAACKEGMEVEAYLRAKLLTVVSFPERASLAV